MKTLAVSALVVTCTWIGVPAQQVVDPLESIHDLRVNGPAGTVLQASGSLTGAGDVRLLGLDLTLSSAWGFTQRTS
jgi:hypothetical protein